MKNFFEFAVNNIVKYGDTDILPFPIENLISYDLREKTVELLLKVFQDYDS